jgi:cbb3-type cytochrome oxidase cytochrome c subunit
MNYGPLIFLAAFFALASSWFGLVLTPQLQVGRLQQTNTIGTPLTYPVARPGLARQGLEVYRANGCAYCHSQQVGQTGTVCDVLLTDAGTNQEAVVNSLIETFRKLNLGLELVQAKRLIVGLPKAVLQGVTREAANEAAKALKSSGAKYELWIAPVGPDIARGWGKRRTVAYDYLFDSPVMLGSQRIGPDLANAGMRLPDANWHLRHLYAPRLEVKDSTMPSYRFLFEKHRIERSASPDALSLPAELAPPSGYEIVPTPEAAALAAYLVSLRADAPLFEVPLTVASPAAEMNAPPAASATNAPAK